MTRRNGIGRAAIKLDLKNVLRARGGTGRHNIDNDDPQGCPFQNPQHRTLLFDAPARGPEKLINAGWAAVAPSHDTTAHAMIALGKYLGAPIEFLYTQVQ